MQKKKKKIAAAASLVLMLSVLLLACTGADKQEESVMAGQTETGTAAAGEMGEETVTETETASSESDLDRLKEWYRTLEGDEFAYYLWNKATGDSELLQNGKYYTLDKEDLLVLYAPEERDYSAIPVEVNVINSDLLNGNGGVSYEISLQNKVVRWNTEVTGKSGAEKNFDFVLVSPDKNEFTKSVTKMIGTEWANSLTGSDPVFLVWNDETNEKRELVNGETYQMKKGDFVGLFYGYTRYYKVDRMTPEIEYYDLQTFPYSILFSTYKEDKGEQYFIAAYKENEGEQYFKGNQTEVSVTLSNIYDPSDVVEISCTLLPPQ